MSFQNGLFHCNKGVLSIHHSCMQTTAVRFRCNETSKNLNLDLVEKKNQKTPPKRKQQQRHTPMLASYWVQSTNTYSYSLSSILHAIDKSVLRYRIYTIYVDLPLHNHSIEKQGKLGHTISGRHRLL